MIANYWPDWFRAQVFQNGAWPTTYCAVDTETTGYSPHEDVVTEWGHVLVEGGEVVDRLSLVVDWSNRDVPPDHWLRNRLRLVKEGMAAQGKTCHMSYELMTAQGMKPEKAFEFVRRFTDRIKARNVPFVLHNHGFDEKMLAACFIGFKFGPGFTFGDRVVDTAAIEKASQVPDNPRFHPRRDEPPRKYFARVNHTRVTGLKSSMDGHCFPKYGLAQKHGISPTDLHAAETDAYCCHLLMQEYGRLVTEPVAPPVYPSADTRAARAPHRPAPPPPSPAGGLRRIRGQRRS